MDENKRLVLVEIDYQIHGVCGLCEHADIPIGGDWGTCRLHEYDHLKHSSAQRSLSISTYGSCPKFEWGAWVGQNLGKFAEFMQPQPPVT